MNHGHITTFIVNDTADGYFVANLDNGGIRVGIAGGDAPMFDFPAGHPLHIVAASLTAETVENFHDERMSIYCQQ